MITTNSWLLTRPIAHRGLHNEEYPENSLGAFQRCIDKNYPIELDVRLLNDNTLVVFHDDTLARMTGLDGYVSQINKEDLKNCKLNKTNFVIPTFREVLDLVDGKVPILIELKTANSSVGPLEKILTDTLTDYTGEYAVQSFNPFSVGWFTEHYPDIIRGQLSCSYKNSDMPFWKKMYLKRMNYNKKNKPDFISYDFHDFPNKYLDKFDGPILAWTVRNEKHLEMAKKYADNIIFENIYD